MPRHKARWLAGQPLNKGAQALITEQAVAIVVSQRQLFFTEQPVDLVMASTADPERGADAFTFSEALLHINLVVQRLGDQMVAREGCSTATELAGIGLFGQTNRFGHTGGKDLAFTTQAQAIA